MKSETIRKIATLMKGQQQYFQTYGQWRAMVHEMADIVQDDFAGWPCKPQFLEAVYDGSIEHPRA